MKNKYYHEVIPQENKKFYSLNFLFAKQIEIAETTRPKTNVCYNEVSNLHSTYKFMPIKFHKNISTLIRPEE